MTYEIAAIIEHPTSTAAAAEELSIQRRIELHGLLIRAFRQGRRIYLSLPSYERDFANTAAASARTH